MPFSKPSNLVRLALAVALLAILAPGARAHELGLVEVLVSFSPEGDYKVEVPIDPVVLLQRIEVSEGKAITETPTPRQVREGLERGLPEIARKLRVIFDGQPVEPAVSYAEAEPTDGHPNGAILAQGRVPEGAKEFQFVYKLVFTRYALKVLAADGGEPFIAWLEGAELSPPIRVVLPNPPTLAEVVKTYVWLGFTHILPKGLDHILFVLGLFLLSRRLRPLLWQVTAFTAAHTITLGLATFGVVSLPATIVEPLIALSIVYVAVENVLHENLGRFRVAVVFAFGLLHGLGFAGVLRELGLPKSQLFPALLSFNVGVELGQLTVIALAFLLISSWSRNKDWYHRRIVVPGSLLIAAVGAYWTIERIWGAFG